MASLMVLLLALSTFSLLRGSEQASKNVVFQPLTYQLKTPWDTGASRPDQVFVAPSINIFRKSEKSSSDDMICKRIEPTEQVYRLFFTAPASPLLVPPTIASALPVSAPLMPVYDDESGLKYYLAVTPPPGEGSESGVPEGSLASPPPLLPALCVSTDSPRPFPVFFAPPAPSRSVSNPDEDFKFEKANPSQFYASKKDMASLTFDPVPKAPPDTMVMTSLPDKPLKFALSIPSLNRVVLGLNGAPVSIESAPSSEDSGRILVKIQTNPPDMFKTDSRAEYSGYGYGSPTSSIHRRQDPLSSAIPSVSLIFSSPVGSIGIGSSSNPAVNIERQSIASSPQAAASANQDTAQFLRFSAPLLLY